MSTKDWKSFIENIFLTNGRVVKIGYLGLSERWEEGITKLIRDPYLAAPELIGGEGDSRSDIYSLGLLAFELATGKNLLDYDLMDEDEDINNSNVQTSFVAICKKAVGNDTGSFRTVSDFLEALNKIG